VYCGQYPIAQHHRKQLNLNIYLRGCYIQVVFKKKNQKTKNNLRKAYIFKPFSHSWIFTHHGKDRIQSIFRGVQHLEEMQQHK
jgi:2-C-methyl-D-erythritol 4-phosphate cytidylyltransferase